MVMRMTRMVVRMTRMVVMSVRHTVKLVAAGRHGHVPCYCRGGGAAGSWASRRFIC
jgi:hypothetical protein